MGEAVGVNSNQPRVCVITILQEYAKMPPYHSYSQMSFQTLCRGPLCNKLS